MKTTLNKIRACHPCGIKPDAGGTLTGLCKLMAHLGKKTTDDDEIDLLTILDSNGLDDAIWTLRAVEGYDREKRLFAVWCARQVEKYTDDPRVKACNDVAERYANGQASQDELSAAEAAAYAAWDTALAAEAAAYAARASAVEAAAWAAAKSARISAKLNADNVVNAAYKAAYADARAEQETEFRRMLKEGCPQ